MLTSPTCWSESVENDHTRNGFVLMMGPNSRVSSWIIGPIRQIEPRGLAPYDDAIMRTGLPETFWTGMQPQLLDTSSSNSP